MSFSFLSQTSLAWAIWKSRSLSVFCKLNFSTLNLWRVFCRSLTNLLASVSDWRKLSLSCWFSRRKIISPLFTRLPPSASFWVTYPPTIASSCIVFSGCTTPWIMINSSKIPSVTSDNVSFSASTLSLLLLSVNKSCQMIKLKKIQPRVVMMIFCVVQNFFGNALSIFFNILYCTKSSTISVPNI